MIRKCPWCLTFISLFVFVQSEDYNIIHNDGSYNFGYDTPHSYHHSQANRNNVVRGEFGARNPKTGNIDSVTYTAGPRGFRPKGKNIARNFDQGQAPRGPIGNRDDPYFDPNEDPSYNFGFKTRTYSRQESANRVGDVNGAYTYLDDVGERHNVEYIAGRRTGFHVKTPFPDSNPKAYGPLYFRGRGKPIPRGRTSIQRGLDGSYRFVSAGPDQRRTETSDASGNVRGSYTYLDDKGLQHSVHYIAGPNIGYRVLKNVKGPHLPSIFPFSGPNIIPSNFYNDLNDNIRPGIFEPSKQSKKPSSGSNYGGGSFSTTPKPFGGSSKPSYDYDSADYGNDDLFGGSSNNGNTNLGSSSSGNTNLGSSSSGNTNLGSSTTPSSTPTGYDDYDEDGAGGGDLFGTSHKPSKPGPSTFRPTGGYPSQKPTSTFRPPAGYPSQKPTSTTHRPSYDDESEEGGDDFGLFEGDNTRPSSTIKPAVITIGAGKEKDHTLVTNVGNTIFTVPPGVTVTAHVQSIDLFPFESKVPSPSDQFRAETEKIASKVLANRDAHQSTTILSTTE